VTDLSLRRIFSGENLSHRRKKQRFWGESKKKIRKKIKEIGGRVASAE